MRSHAEGDTAHIDVRVSEANAKGQPAALSWLVSGPRHDIRGRQRSGVGERVVFRLSPSGRMRTHSSHSRSLSRSNAVTVKR